MQLCIARGGLYRGEELIIGCMFWFTGRWAYNRGLISGGEGGYKRGKGAYKRQFTVH